jgi:hypothetical protein
MITEIVICFIVTSASVYLSLALITAHFLGSEEFKLFMKTTAESLDQNKAGAI